ncbi:MAG TPA: hypothetical protein VID47_19530 [Actinomycetota bacterium]|jgi:multisubunit Na+/H+ antiporter MnhC subunit
MATFVRRNRDQRATVDPLTAVYRQRRSPWLGRLFIFWAVGIGAWSAWLTVTLPNRHLAPNWNIAWGGFDVIMAIALISSGIAAWRGSPWFPMCAVATATLLVVDAWFDILTSNPGDQLVQAIAMALIVELPLAALFLVMAYRRNKQARTLLRTAGSRAERESEAA